MPRLARSELQDGGFHVTARGNRRQPIFVTSGDALPMAALIDDESDNWELRTYCLMPNHVHVVVIAEVEKLANAMRRINGVYAGWFNAKYGLSGHVFQGRYKAKPLADERHMYEAIVYVLLNPVRAGLCRHPGEWPWCNWMELVRDAYIVTLVEEALRGLSPKGAVPIA